MNINQLTEVIKKKLLKNDIIKSLKIEDKTFLHKHHMTNEDDKFHLVLIIESPELKKKNKLFSNRYIFKILEYEIKNYIHSVRILFS